MLQRKKAGRSKEIQDEGWKHKERECNGEMKNDRKNLRMGRNHWEGSKADREKEEEKIEGNEGMNGA